MTPAFQCLSGARYGLLAPLRWRIGGPLVDHAVLIPAGFTFDSSVPRALRWLLSPHDPRFLLAACIHDWLLEQGYGRAQAAAEWYDGARAGGAPASLARCAYIAVASWAVFKPARAQGDAKAAPSGRAAQ
jgi:hypothetical protein